MSSLKTLAAEERQQIKKKFYIDNDRRVLVPALCEIAHALSRGRKPSTCSLLPGKNLQEWLRYVFCEEKENCHDMVGDNASLVADLEVALYGWGYDDPDTPTIMKAIRLCNNYIHSLKKPSDCRGDFNYQWSHPVTNLKKKREWLKRTQGSCYDYDDSDYSYLTGIDFCVFD